ncbi:Predicted arabinose efflux permease, MFS family [Muriicola jejuensis]|uniref:MFS transporter n=1 Tax=Muriicola jejuensis TaxID=504488 RepID=A0A6P0UBR3_9FLAO|nr:MFS transporter [Muriicola jejuensis]NER10685.1 MFS transporter [Muriicola jejuensis]SMP16994.1 Predicted arabinose efflux permease, MFS family [Muriicola jejuensis]
MKLLYLSYLNSFRGLSREVWWLALVTLINRAGTMVIPFLSLYLTRDRGFALEDVGTIMSCFGLGSLAGTWLGGKLTDRIGYYKVMVWSLFLTGLLFIWLQVLESFYALCGGIFVLMVVADSFRPATYVAMSAYSKHENKTRSVTLIRLAINLGFSAGPAIGGVIIASMGYLGLFWVDGITCLLAALLLLLVLNPKKAKELDVYRNEAPRSAYKDYPYLLFIGAMILLGLIFVQYFSTVPLFYSEARSLSEVSIGLLLAMNGFIIFAFEMPLIKFLETSTLSRVSLMMLGLALTTCSYFFLTFGNWTGLLVIGMILMTLGEMVTFPFSSAFAMERSRTGRQGEYMALYNIAFSISHIFAHNGGMVSIANFGYRTTWYIAMVVGVMGILLLYLLRSGLLKGRIR